VSIRASWPLAVIDVDECVVVLTVPAKATAGTATPSIDTKAKEVTEREINFFIVLLCRVIFTVRERFV
jgi:hypothetical protein